MVDESESESENDVDIYLANGWTSIDSLLII